MEKPLRQIVYFSTAAIHQDAQMVASLMETWRDCQRHATLTGLLVAGGNRYLQVIEGPRLPVDILLKQIRRNECHVGLTILVNRRIRTRRFNGWTAHFENPDGGNYATLKQLVGQMRRRVGDDKLRNEIDCFERRFTVASPAPAASPWTLANSYAPGSTFNRSH